jgi:hypothetical protein
MFSTIYATDTVTFTLLSSEGNKYVKFGPSDLTNIKAVTLNQFTSYSLSVYDLRSSGTATIAAKINTAEGSGDTPITYANTLFGASKFTNGNIVLSYYFGINFGKFGA